MNKRIDLSILGGFPLEQDTLDFMQSSYRGAFGALATLCGNKVIVSGVVVAGGNVSDGWIVYNGELIPFVGGSVATYVVITETAVQATYEDTNLHDVYFTKSATCAASGDFPFADLVPLLSLQNTWRPGDLKEKIFADGATADAYIAANFDVDGYGLNVEKGWRILTAVYPATAGKVMVPVDSSDAALNQVGKTTGAKTHTLTPAEQGDFTVAVKSDDGGGSASGGYTMNVRTQYNGVEPASGTANAAAFGTALTVALRNTADAHSIMQPTYAILKLVKL